LPTENPIRLDGQVGKMTNWLLGTLSAELSTGEFEHAYFRCWFCDFVKRRKKVECEVMPPWLHDFNEGTIAEAFGCWHGGVNIETEPRSLMQTYTSSVWPGPLYLTADAQGINVTVKVVSNSRSVGFSLFDPDGYVIATAGTILPGDPPGTPETVVLSSSIDFSVNPAFGYLPFPSEVYIGPCNIAFGGAAFGANNFFMKVKIDAAKVL
jgi:hypothetical protein